VFPLLQVALKIKDLRKTLNDIQHHKIDVAKPHESPHRAIPSTAVSTRRTG
jgi:hypothetical protein